MFKKILKKVFKVESFGDKLAKELYRDIFRMKLNYIANKLYKFYETLDINRGISTSEKEKLHFIKNDLERLIREKRVEAVYNSIIGEQNVY